MLLSLPGVLAQENDWPRTLPLEQGTVTIYSLQVDEMNDDIIHFRAALAYRATAGSEPVFGAGWFESRVEIDSSSRIVHPTDLKVTETRFPDGTDDVQSGLSAVLAQQSPGWNLDFSVDELEAALKQSEAESKAAQNLNTAPPRIIYRDHPALLISIDGEPVLRAIEESPFEAVINTPYPLIFDGSHYYLNAANGVWYRADKVTGPYRFEAHPPADIAAMVNADEADAIAEQPDVPITAANAPEIVVSVEPAELIVTEGPAAFVPLVDDLLVLQNSDDDVFMHVSSQKFYTVLAGRWYHASSLNGPWAYQAADDLPAAFANIPHDSDQADSRVYVAGTQEAREAVLDAQVPQTAAVTRGEVDIEVVYDGDPIYQPVDGTDLVYIQNTGSAVLLSDGLYYLVEDGVWYVSASSNGPWQVSTQRPAQVDTILPTSPVHNVKYVHVYDSTPSVVYVGYTPGYTGSYVYHNTIFYGSGWYYQPWVSPYYYYPRHSTWGWNVSYNPWSGWNFGLSWGWGPFSVSYYTGGYWHQNHYWHHRHYGHWGPGHYRPRHYGHRGHGRDRYAHRGDGRRDHGRNDNIYRDDAQRARIRDTRDNQRQRPRGRDGDTRQAYDTAPGASRDQSYARKKKDGRSRIEPISSSDLRNKANVRDANLAAKRDLLLADNNGKVYRKSDRGRDHKPDRNDAIRRSTRPDKGTKHRTMPVPPTNKQGVSRQRRSQEGNISDRQPQSRKVSNRAAQRPPNVVSTPGPDKVTKHRTMPVPPTNKQVVGRQRRSQEVNTPDRQSQHRKVSNRAAQRPPQVVSTPGPGKNSSRPSPQPQRSQKNGRNNSAPDQRAPQRSAQKTNSQRARSNSVRRTGGSRPKKL